MRNIADRDTGGITAVDVFNRFLHIGIVTPTLLPPVAGNQLAGKGGKEAEQQGLEHQLVLRARRFQREHFPDQCKQLIAARATEYVGIRQSGQPQTVRRPSAAEGNPEIAPRLFPFLVECEALAGGGGKAVTTSQGVKAAVQINFSTPGSAEIEPVCRVGVRRAVLRLAAGHTAAEQAEIVKVRGAPF